MGRASASPVISRGLVHFQDVTRLRHQHHKGRTKHPGGNSLCGLLPGRGIWGIAFPKSPVTGKGITGLSERCDGVPYAWKLLQLLSPGSSSLPIYPEGKYREGL